MADKSFGVKELNLLNASGTPTVTSPNNLNLNANTVAISTSCTIGSNLTVSGDIDVDGHTNLDNVSVAGVSTFSTRIDTNGVSLGTNNNTFAAKFVDDAVANFGTGNDLKIYHESSSNSSYIKEEGAGSLYIQGVNVVLENPSGTNYFAGVSGAESIIYHNGNAKITTSNSGATVTGTLTATTFSGDPSNDSPHSSWDVVNNSASSYRFTGPGQDGAEDNPDIYLVRGQRYVFKMNASGHPFQIRVANAGAAYSDGVTNNGAETGNVIFNVQHDAPAQLFYQCTSHGSMVGNIYIIGGSQVISGVVTATTFVGALTGNATGLSGTPNISAGTIAGSTGTFTGDVVINDTTADGNVHPDTKLHVKGGITFRELTSASEGALPAITQWSSDGVGQDLAIGTRSAGGDVLFFTGNTATDGDWGVSSNAERLRITSAGKIEVKGTRAGSLQASDDDTLKLYTASSDNSIDRGSGITFYNHDNSGYEMGGTIQVAKENGTADNVAAYMRFSTTPAGGSATERLRISSTGAVTKPAQPCAVVYQCTGPAGGAANASSDNQEPLHFDHVHISQGGMTISQDNGRIEVPVTGIYFVSFMVSGTVSTIDTNDGIELLLMVNGNEYPATNSGIEPVFNFGHGHSSATTHNLVAHTEFACSNTILVSLTAGDYVEVAVDNIGNSDGTINRGNFNVMLMA